MKSDIRKISNMIAPFLKRNGFDRMEAKSYANHLCNVVIEDEFYTISDNNGLTFNTKSHSLYELIGFLSYHSFITQHYKR